MKELVTRLMLHGQSQQAMLPTAIFGTAGSVAQGLNAQALPVRIGMWPIQCSSEPQVAMGMMVVLSYLLERYRMIRAYPLVAQVDGLPEDYHWEIGLSQFGVDDWPLDDLDDNVGLWGELIQTEGLWKLELTVENDLDTSVIVDDTRTFTYQAKELAALVGMLPQAAADIASFLDTDELEIIAPGYETGNLQEHDFKPVLEHVFQLELQLYLSLWGRGWPEPEVVQQVDQLLTAAGKLGNFGAWLVAQAVARLSIFIDVEYMPIVRSILAAFPDSLDALVIVSRALFNKPEMTADGIELLQTAIEEDHISAEVYLALGEMYRTSGRVDEMVERFQEAIESDVTSVALLQRYAEIMTALDYNNYEIDTFIMADPDEVPEDTLLWEAIETYEAILEIEPENVLVRSRQLQQMIELGQDNERLWTGFKRLVDTNNAEEQVRIVVDVLENLENLMQAIHILKTVAEANPDHVERQINLAAVLILNDDTDSAMAVLNRIRGLTDDEALLDDIERLLLIADDPEFEMRLGEITDILSAGNAIDSDDVEFLENIIEKVPAFAEAYILLAQAYIRWDERSTTIETLLDGHRLLPDNPDIIVLLSEQLWESGEEALALKYLGTGITQNPNYVPLLALTGLYLFEDGQEDNARVYLQRAESLAPRHPMLARVRQQISQALDD